MKRQVYMLSGLACPNCAARLEKAVGRIAGVKTAEVAFATGALTVEHSGASAVTEAINQTITQSDLKITTVLDA